MAKDRSFAHKLAKAAGCQACQVCDGSLQIQACDSQDDQGKQAVTGHLIS